MRALMGLVVGMGVLIVAGVATLGVMLVHRLGAAAPALAVTRSMSLDEPAGTRVASAAGSGGTLTAVLQGGGPDRILVIDLATGRVTARVSLAR
jgi:hypothetical protein